MSNGSTAGRNSEVARLRDLHAALDRAVLDAYGWRDIPTDCDFLLDYAIDEEEQGRKKKPFNSAMAADAVCDSGAGSGATVGFGEVMPAPRDACSSPGSVRSG